MGASMAQVESIDKTHADPRIFTTQFSIACDVTNPLTGPNGASFVFSPQKGASPDQVMDLDLGLQNLGNIIARDLGINIADIQGSGAAGGLGGGMKAFFNADLTAGIDLVLDYLNFHTQIQDADLVLTAEGRMDSQTCFNKAPAGVARAAKKAGVPCFAICGSLDNQAVNDLHEIGINAMFSICNSPISLETAMKKTFSLLSIATQEAVRAFLWGKMPP
jgi:glycerate kinase